MANPQKENGFTILANELLQAIIRYPLTATELKIVMRVFRETYGYSRKKAQMSFGEISLSTGLDRRSVIRAFHGLVLKRVLFVQETLGARASNVIGINKNYENWDGADRLDLVFFANRRSGDRPSKRNRGVSDDCADPVDNTGFSSGCIATRENSLVSSQPLENGSLVVKQPPPSDIPATRLVVTQPPDNTERNRNKALNKAGINNRLEKSSEKKDRAQKLVQIAELVDGLEMHIKSKDPRPLMDRLVMAGYEPKIAWGAIVQARAAQNPPGYLVNTLADGKYPVSDGALEQAAFEMRSFNY